VIDYIMVRLKKKTMPTFGNSECAFMAQLDCKSEVFFRELEDFL